MIIHMVAERPSDRLNWQYQLNQFKGKVDFTLGPTIPHIRGLSINELCGDEIILVLFNSLEDLEGIAVILKSLAKGVNVVALVSKVCEFNFGKSWIEKELQRLKPHLGAVYFETFNDSDVFFQCLFKPQRNLFKTEIEQKGEDETRLIEMAETEEKSVQKQSAFWSRKRKVKTHSGIWRLFKKTNKEQGAWLGKQPRLRLCVHGESALAYELGAIWSTVSEQSVLILDLDRMAPTADLYCGIKAVVKEKYDFYSKATATGLNILLDCMKKSALNQEAFRLCTQQPKGYPNFHVLTGAYKLEDYEYYKGEDLKRLIESASKYYDVILMKTNSFPYDGFTLNSFLIADAILWGGLGSIEQVRYNRQLIQLMELKQKITMDKQFWVLFERSGMASLEKRFLIEMGLGTYCGNIPYCEKREKCQSTGEAYLFKERQTLERIYEPVIKSIYKGGC